MMPDQKPGLSKQDYQTPQEFIIACLNRLRISEFTWDLAASAQNTQADHFITQEQDSLKQRWHELDGWLWLNPPYADIKPWVEKAHEESLKGALIAILIPASVGANWWRDYVNNSCYQLFLNGRITFVGCSTPYPKDCALLLYTPFIRSGNSVWDWRKELEA
jgi:DNA (cytosine-5)-methyltransferase 1